MSKKSNDKIIKRDELYKRGWDDFRIETRLPDELKEGGWYLSMVEMMESGTQIGLGKKKEIDINNKKTREKIKKITKNLDLVNPANDYPLARAMRRHFIINVGATNTGKTYTALQELKKTSDGVYLSPLRLLAMEVQDTLLESGCLCSMTTGEEEYIIPNSTVMSSTVEKLNIDHHYEVGVIDECQMIEDAERGGAWTRAILGILADVVYLCMSPEALNICIKLIELCGDTYEINECKRTTKLTMCDEPVGIEDLQKGDAIILYSRREVLDYALNLENLGISASVIYGALPYEARKNQVDLYKNGQTDIVVSTDAIGMGLNLPIRRIIFAADEKFDGTQKRTLTSQEVKQVAGRAGRRGIFEEGFVSTFSESEANRNVIAGLLAEEPYDIEKVILPFPEECITENMKISQTMELWSKIKYEDGFVTENLKERIAKIKYLEDSEYNFDKKTMLLLSKVIFDENDIDLYNLYEAYIDCYYNGEEICSPYSHYQMTLKELELNYKALRLFYSFCRTMDIEIDIDRLQQEKIDIVKRINRELAKEKKKKIIKKCRYCNKDLPPFFKFNICEECYGKSRRFFY